MTTTTDGTTGTDAPRKKRVTHRGCCQLQDSPNGDAHSEAAFRRGYHHAAVFLTATLKFDPGQYAIMAAWCRRVERWRDDVRMTGRYDATLPPMPPKVGGGR